MSPGTDERQRQWLRIAVFAFAAGMVNYLEVLTAFPHLRAELPSWLGWFGAPGSVTTIVIACATIGFACTVGWRQFRPTGTVVAQRHGKAWSWTSASGRSMRAGPGEWAVGGPSGNSWSVCDDIFRSTHHHIDGNLWCRCSLGRSRRARGNEVIETLEGPLPVEAGDWIVQGQQGEQTPVRPEIFTQQYEGPLPGSAAPEGHQIEAEVR